MKAILFMLHSKGEIMSKKEYLACVLRLLTPEQIRLSAENPTPYMRPIHIKLHYVALRRLGAI